MFLSYLNKINKNKIHTIVNKMDIVVALVNEYQNLNSGSFLLNGLNSSDSSFLLGSKGPSDSGSICGERKRINKLSA